ncbi:MAG TPA: DUF4178 domain-containing protein [Calditrichia bacterium]|nr:DUF4178 domain-containing protein [Calditrichota bacterium]HQU73952.1 DUF4178 domain-containing protein [Calditrichia bacterium]HQV30967.1 DUF4178 domain-containing protein [Calditrichia bacterium]
MGFFDRFKKDADDDGFDPLDLQLSRLRVGYLVDYDLKTWEVKAYNRYDFGEGQFADEWELQADGQSVYLNREKDDEEYWSLSKKLPLGAIEENIKKHIMENEDPPNQITVKGQTYYLDASAPGYLLKGGYGPRVPFIVWEFIDEEDRNFVTIEQWDESEFEASIGFEVEEYQFSNILPGS